MSIEFSNNIFHLHNEHFSYCILLSAYGDLLHMYYGAPIEPSEADFIIRERASFSAYDIADANYSLDVLPQEYPMYGAQDLRRPALSIEFGGAEEKGRLIYKSHKIFAGKPAPAALPAVYANSDEEFTTLMITLIDEAGKFEADLYYSVSETLPVICRRAVIRNVSAEALTVTKAMSASLDFRDYDYDYMHLHGAWAREKHIETAPVRKGFCGIESRRGASGSAENPFIALMRKGATEDFGEVYGMSLIYSGGFVISIDVEQYDTMRVMAGISPQDFKWRLLNGEEFETPELVMVYSNEGLGAMSRTFHRLYRKNLCRGVWRDKARPVLINNWEATYFDFDEQKLLDICKCASELGMELFVLDDGWFGKRNSDNSSLGDWYVNREKLPDGLSGLAEKVKEYGMSFGLWVEPEMISRDSDLFRAHPDWALAVDGRPMHEGRHQYVLDMGRDDVIEYLAAALTNVLSSADISYVKWDMNRNITDANSRILPRERQGEVLHRYILGLYKLLDIITPRFPNILFEGCSGGAGRNDPGMLYYMPQNWGSDDTDAAERMYIQYGASMVYPISSICAHVSAVPNHQVGRVTPMKMRGDVATCAVLGYELDLSKISADDAAEIAEITARYKRLRDVVINGDFYRLINPFENRSAAWMTVSEDKKRAAVFYFNRLAGPNAGQRFVRLKGLLPDMRYRIGDNVYSGSTLMNYGLPLPSYEKDFESMVWELEAIDAERE